MKTQIKWLQNIMLLSLFIIAAACSKDDSVDSPATGKVDILPSSISLDEFETDKGAIGISISARDIAKRGYKPTTAVISFQSTSNIEDQTLTFDEFNNLVYVSFKVEDLENAVKNELKEGIPVDVIVKDETGGVLATQNFSKLSFIPSPDTQEIDASSLDDLFADVSLKEDLDYYVQIVNKENEVFGAPGSQRYPDINNLATDIRFRGDLNYNSNADYFAKFTTYRFAKIPNNDDYFSIAVHNGNDIHYLYMSSGRLNIQSKANLNKNKGNTNVANFDNYWFRIKKQGPGLFKIIPRGSENPIINSGANFVRANSIEPDNPTYFRILLFNIDWDIQAIESKFLKPIMPPNGTQSAYNSTLKNCSSGSLTQTVGESTTIETIQTTGWEESMSIASTHSAGVSVSISHEVETKFFGVGGKTTGTFESNYQYTKTKTETNTTWADASTAKSVQVSVSREIGVPPNTAISVADIYQQYENIKVPFVQRFRIFGKYQEDNTELSGQEILTQFAFNSFTGVVTDVQSNFIEVTVRGTTVIDRIIDTVTQTRDIPNACNN